MTNDYGRFEWDPHKAEANYRKHGIRFEKAILVFADQLAKVVRDRIVDGEQRWHIIGMADDCLLLLVVHAYREIDDMEMVRIISARPASRRERRIYGNG